MKALLLSLLLLTGCATVVPVTQSWPEPPGVSSTQACPPLEKLSDNATLSMVAKTISANYSEYYQCAVKLAAWQEWYAQQKIIYESLK